MTLRISGRDEPNRRIYLAEYLTNHHQFAPETILKISPSHMYLKDPEKSNSILLFFKENGFSKSHLEQIIEHFPKVLFSNIDTTIKPKIKLFQGLGFSPIDIAEIISRDPWILTRSVNCLDSAILALKNTLGSTGEVCRILKISSWFLKHDLKKTMTPNIEFMRSCGISHLQMVKFMYNFPRFFLIKTQSMKEYVKRVDEFGLDRNSKYFLFALRVISSMTVEHWELKLQLFRSLGFSENDIVSVFRRVPNVFALSERKIKRAVQVILGTGKYDISYIIKHTHILMHSVENRIEPRLRVIEILESKNLLSKKYSLTTVCKISNKQFYQKYVIPHSNEVGKTYICHEVQQIKETCTAG